jgi:two-component system cell cycle response regulator CtrA
MLVLRVGSDRIFRAASDRLVLAEHGMLCEQAISGREAAEFLRLYDYDLALIDQHLPDGPCDEVIRRIRAANHKVPVMILADAATGKTKAQALDLGADDFITVPCEAEELIARIRAVVRRTQGYAHSVLRAGNAELSLDRRQLRVHDQVLPLSRREFAILELLFLKQGVIVTKSALFNRLYCGLDEPEMKAVDVIICRLRKKLTRLGVPSLIDTVWGSGYTLRTVEPIEQPPSASVWAASTSTPQGNWLRGLSGQEFPGKEFPGQDFSGRTGPGYNGLPRRPAIGA